MNASYESEKLMEDILRGSSKEELEELLKKVSWNEGYGCYTRTGFELVIWPEIKDRAEWFVYFDINGLHELNAEHGSYEPVNVMIKDVLSITRSTDLKAAMLQSGDEIFIVILKNSEHDGNPVDPQGLVGRLVHRFSTHNMSATFDIVPALSPDLMTNLEPAVKKVHAIKNRRGSLRRTS